MTLQTFPATRAAGLERLAAFTPSMAGLYRAERNYDYGPDKRANVSVLSPYIRARLITEREAASAALEAHGLSAAEKYIQEVCWRTYWKGWLEHRPSVWMDYQTDLEDMLPLSGGIAKAYTDAIEGRTGIEAADAWARELTETGYLHNHARMWFASIWIYTLGLPWQLGADFFLQHLADGDAASNTLSWRWVAGLHTRGKTYLARPGNIEKYTAGRFAPTGLASDAPPLDGLEPPPPSPPSLADPLPSGPVALLLTEDDLSPESLLPAAAEVTAIAGASFAALRSPHGVGNVAETFIDGALSDGLTRAGEAFGAEAARLPSGDGFHTAAMDWAATCGARQIVMAEPPTGWARPPLDKLRADLARADIRLHYIRRDWDTAFWPHASKGFFKLKKQIPKAFAQLGLT